MAVEKISDAHKMKSVAKMFGVFWMAKVSLAISPTHLVSCISNMCVMPYTRLFFLDTSFIKGIGTFQSPRILCTLRMEKRNASVWAEPEEYHSPFV